MPDDEKFYWLFGDLPDEARITTEFVVLDTETTGLQWTDDLLGVSLAWRNEAGSAESCYISKVPGLFEDAIWPAAQVNDLIARLYEHKVIVGHYFSFDARVIFREFGITPRFPMDTWHMSRSVAYRKSHSLENLAKAMDIQDPEWFKDKENRANLSKNSPHSNSVYARKDAIYTMYLYEWLLPAYQSTGLLNTDMDFGRLVYDMMARGFPVNTELLDQRIKSESAEFMRLQTLLASKGIPNVSNPEAVTARLKELGYMVENASAPALFQYANDPLIADVIKATQYQSNINARMMVFKKYLRNGRLHAEWHPFGTASYRMVAKDPNMMAQPLKDREGRTYDPLAELFTTPDEYCLQLDISQAEVRLAAMLSKSNSMAVFLSSGSDAYMEMAKKAYGVANKESRQKAKRATLASIYEEGPRAFSEKHGVSYDEAAAILDQFRKSFPEIKIMSGKYMAYAKEYGFINLYTGRKIYFDKADERLYRAFNQEVQGGVAELMRSFMLKMDEEFPGKIIGQIHDSLILNLQPYEVSRQTIDVVKETSLRLLQESLPEKVSALTNPIIPLKLDYEPLKRAIDEEF